ncbi:LamG-like jellyroll fold domain-containing protein [Thalassotalea sp. ND16A]|uniref:LamG-like jellyroll fold domain-containing protein n=1 Tax=Thalassotalea sp. ND16A TaxID=1535422 RepID=UPI00051A5581|nr:LamG-like jellyroll fold domain-containing protein [Thalassotalea sp. ND16A]KGK00116.1 hypothetical protein ND16A_0307 [Thalassotalea sp. ND16A]
MNQKESPSIIKNSLKHWMKYATAAMVLPVCVNAQGLLKNYAVDFPGNNATINFNTVSALENKTEFTIDFWLKMDSWAENSLVISNALDTHNRVDIQLGTESNKRVYFHIANGTNEYAALNNAPLTVGQWHHVTMAYNGALSANNQITITIDGATMNPWYRNGQGTVATSSPATASPFKIGKNFDGQIDELKIWEKKLSDADITSDNTINPQHPLYASLTNYWRMDQHSNSTTVQDYKGTNHGTIATGVTRNIVTDNNKFSYKVVSAYIRPHLYKTGVIEDDYLRNNNDIINMITSVKANGDLFFDTPISDGTLVDTTHLSSFAGRTGIADFNGSGAKMNAGKDLMVNGAGGDNNFAFVSWVYLDSWQENSFIFQKTQDWQNRIDLQLGSAASKTLYFHVANGANNYVAVNAADLTVGQWHHIAVSYNGNECAENQAQIYIDGVAQDLWYHNAEKLLPTKAPYIQDDLELGVNFDGKMDEALVYRVNISPGNVINHMNNGVNSLGWPNNQLSARWEFEDSQQPGKDSETWVNVFDAINQVFAGYEGVEHRVGVMGFLGTEWKTMIASDTARQNFASNVKQLVDQVGFDGVDLDFEWCYSNTTCNTNYASTVAELDSVLAADETLSITLHPISYQLPLTVVDNVDFISIQSYGPDPLIFTYEKYVDDIQQFINYGYPKEKIIAGVPFYAVSDPRGIAIDGYSKIVAEYPNLSPSSDEEILYKNIRTGPVCGGTWQYDVPTTMVFNGKDTISAKAAYANEQGLGGIMYWDTALDVDYDHPLCLLKAVNAEINANIQIPFTN